MFGIFKRYSGCVIILFNSVTCIISILCTGGGESYLSIGRFQQYVCWRSITLAALARPKIFLSSCSTCHQPLSRNLVKKIFLFFFLPPFKTFLVPQIDKKTWASDCFVKHYIKLVPYFFAQWSHTNILWPSFGVVLNLNGPLLFLSCFMRLERRIYTIGRTFLTSYIIQWPKEQR